MDIKPGPLVTVGRRIPSASGLHSGSGNRLSSSRQHSRNKSSTDPADVLKAMHRQLTKYAHQTSSQFALIVVDAKGNMQLPIPATSAFKGYLDKWIPDQVRQEARQIAISAADEKKVRRRRDGVQPRHERIQPPLDGEGEEDDEEEEEEEEDWPGKSMSHEEAMLRSTAPHDDDQDMHKKKRPSQDDMGTPRKKKTVPRPDPVRRSSPESFIQPCAEFQSLIIGDEVAVTTFYMTRLRQMQQLMCKVVAKAWIKVIEPKKQSNFPYNRGNESRPTWWPENVRHKEPDHLMKPERLELLLTMLRCGKVPISKLVAATSEVMVQIPKERIPLLEEIYMVAEREQRCKAGEVAPESAVYVASSAEKIISRPAASREQRSPEERQSVASPTHTNSGRGNSVSEQSPTHSDLNSGHEMDIQVPSRLGSRDESASRIQHPQTPHNPFSGSNSGASNLNPTIEYPTSYVPHASPIQTSPIQDQQQFMGDPISMQRYYTLDQPPSLPILRRGNTMPSISQASAGPVHHTWGNSEMLYAYSPSTPPSHAPYGPMPRQQSSSNPQTPVTASSFQGLQLPPPPPHPQDSHQGHQNSQQTQLGHRPSHHNLGSPDDGSGHQYDAPGHMGTQIGGNANPLGFTEFLRSGLATDDGNGRGKME